MENSPSKYKKKKNTNICSTRTRSPSLHVLQVTLDKLGESEKDRKCCKIKKRIC